jgi:cell wall-associated NlpC family hydrolase
MHARTALPHLAFPLRTPARQPQLPGRGAVFAVCVAAALLLAGCSSAPRQAQRPTVSSPAAHAANAVLMRAIGLVGTPYRYGGNTPQGGFDCSGLVGFVFADAAGLALPRSTAEIARMPATSVGRDRLAAGDLVLFTDAGRVSHIGIYVGDARFVHAPSTGGTVRLDPLDAPYWQKRFAGGRRLLR